VYSSPPSTGLEPRERSTDLLALARDGWIALRRHRRRAAQVFVGLLAIAIVGALLLPRMYESEAKLMVKIGRESVTLDPTATVGQTLSVYDSRETEVNTVLEIMGSRAVLDDVVTELGPQFVLQGSGAGDEPRDPAVPIEPALREEAIEALQESTIVDRGTKSNIVSVVVRSYSPEAARRIARAMLDAFRGRYLTANRTAGSFDFFVDQERVVAARLAEATGELNDVRNGLGVGTVEAERAKVEAQLASVESQRMTNGAALAAANARIAALERSIATLPERRVSQEVTGFAEDAAGRTRSQIYALKLEEHDLLTRFQTWHPDVIAVHERIDDAERTLQVESARTTQTTTADDPARRQLELALLTERSDAESFRAGAQELDRQHAATLDRLRRLNESEARLVQLGQRVDRLRADHRDYAGKLEQARIDQALAEDRISNVNVWQQPTLVSKPVGSQRRLVCVLGLFVAALGAAGTAFGLEFLERRRRDEAAGTVPDGSLLGRELAHAMSR
jgi:polysaccharide biosynthesis protein PslE